MLAFYEDILFYTTLETFKYRKEIKNSIDASSDSQNRKTNVKAKMTDWNMTHLSEFNELGKEMLNYCSIVSKNRYAICPELYIKEMWGMHYLNDDYAMLHDHWPATWACVYYPEVDEGVSSLIFPELDIEIIPQNNMLVVFPGWLSHKVDKKEFFGKRYVVSANIYAR